MRVEWDAVEYDALPLPHEDWGRRTLARLSLEGDERVLDAGCGTGRDTEALLERLPLGRVVALDGSTAMLRQLRSRLANTLSRIDVVEADLRYPLPIQVPVDAVLSVATFHWIEHHAALFANLAAVVRPGGRLVSDCGGAGNLAAVNAAIVEVLGDDRGAWRFPSVEETERALAKAGFTALDVRLRPHPVFIGSPRLFRRFLKTVILGGHLKIIPPEHHEHFVSEVAARLPEQVVDYVRLEITASRDPSRSRSSA